ncbi:hypothetical protein [Mesobacillus harenae]|uniref:hypothetical protein n=1 Tax=Mesobacillus harenae TaxID=2213203 RepID=UPI00158008B4|nr:hypothetical protein [Mesobacillus harenae]
MSEVSVQVKAKRDRQVLFNTKCFAVNYQEDKVRLLSHLNLGESQELILEIDKRDSEGSSLKTTGKILEKSKDPQFGYIYLVEVLSFDPKKVY